jgi:hypothetical protein
MPLRDGSRGSSGAEDVKPFEPGSAIGTTGAGSCLKRAAEPALVEVLHIAEGEKTHGEGRIGNDVVDKLRCNRESIKD